KTPAPAAIAEAAEMTSPPPGSTLSATAARFEWTGGVAVSQYWLYVGTTPGGAEIANRDQSTNLATTVIGLPASSAPVYVRLWSLVDGVWQSMDYTYATAGAQPAPAEMIWPPPGSTLSSTATTFRWSGGSEVSEYRLSIGT